MVSINTIADETNSISAGNYSPHSHTGTCCAVDDSGGYADGPGGDNSSFSNFTTDNHASMHPVLWMIQGATSTILVAAPPMIGARSVTSPLPL